MKSEGECCMTENFIIKVNKDNFVSEKQQSIQTDGILDFMHPEAQKVANCCKWGRADV